MSKLSDSDKLEIRRQYGNGQHSYGDLAKVYGVTRQAIRDVVKGHYTVKGNPLAGKVPVKKGRKASQNFTQIPSQHVTEVLPAGLDLQAASRLDEGAVVQYQMLYGKLMQTLAKDEARLAALQADELAYRTSLNDEQLRDKLAMKVSGLACIPRYKDLPADMKALVDAELPSAKFNALWNLHSRMCMAQQDHKDTISRATGLLRAMNSSSALTINNNTLVIEGAVDQALKMMLQEVVFPVLNSMLPRKVAQVMTRKMDELYRARQAQFSKLVTQQDVK